MNQQLPIAVPTRRISKWAIISSLFAVVAMLGLTFAAQPANATHSWNGYHWARTANPFTVKVGSNVSSSWQPYLDTTSIDWSASSVLNTTLVAGQTTPKMCRATQGMVQVCSAKYGTNGWLGLAQIWISGSHITQGTAKMNDTYFTQPSYNNSAEKEHVMCQEVGHTFGLGHQDETGLSLGTCMDYSQDPNSQHPNAHDYEELNLIYGHFDSTTTVASSTASAAELDPSDHSNRGNMGRRVFRSQDGVLEVYEIEFHDGSKLVSFLILAE